MSAKNIYLLLFVILFFGSCNDEETDIFHQTNAPEIEFVFDPVANKVIDTVMIGQLVKIVGEDLRVTKKVSVNNVEVAIGTDATIAGNSIYLKIPRVSRQKQNVIIVESENGTATHQVNIKFPPFAFTGMYNEYTPRGGEMTILGESMDLYVVAGKNKVKFGEVEGEVTAVSEFEIKVKVPDNAPDNAVVSFVSEETGSVVCPGRYRDNFFIIDNLEDKSKTRYPDAVVPNATFPAPLTPPAIEGAQYSRAVRSTPGTLNMAGNYNVVIPDALLEDGENYELKFEMFTVLPIAFRFAVSLNQGTTNYMVGPSSLTTDPKLMLTTGGTWKTFAIPLSYWKGKGGAKNLRVFVTIQANNAYDVCFDTFRIQRKGNDQ